MMTHTLLNNDEILRYSRQILLDNWDIEAQLALKQARVLVIGAGGLGACLTPTLVRAGVGFLHINDFDEIEASNLQRQPLYFNAHIGQKKAKIASDMLKKHNELVSIEYSTQKITKHSLPTLLQNINPNLVIDCTDNFLTRDIINAITRAQNIPLLSTAAIAQTGQLALFEPDTACYACIFGQGQQNADTCANSGVLASTVAVIGALGADVALQFLALGQNPIKHKLLLWQGQSLSLRALQFGKNKDCVVCKT